MLTYAFDLLHAIYEEEGYHPAEIPGLILRHNLYGIEIDARAGALAAFALTIKAREIPPFLPADKMVQANIVALQNVRFKGDELRDYMKEIDPATCSPGRCGRCSGSLPKRRTSAR